MFLNKIVLNAYIFGLRYTCIENLRYKHYIYEFKLCLTRITLCAQANFNHLAPGNQWYKKTNSNHRPLYSLDCDLSIFWCKKGLWLQLDLHTRIFFELIWTDKIHIGKYMTISLLGQKVRWLISFPTTTRPYLSYPRGTLGVMGNL